MMISRARRLALIAVAALALATSVSGTAVASSATITINGTASILSGGTAVRVTGSVRCAPSTHSFAIAARVVEYVNRAYAKAAGTVAAPACDGAWHSWSVDATARYGTFVPGSGAAAAALDDQTAHVVVATAYRRPIALS